MTLQSQVLDNKNYFKYLDHGFAGLKDVMGNDAAIVEAARTSYGEGTKTINEDRGLIRYLVRHQHTSPLEMVVFKFHLKMPIFVMRQHVRHRMSSINEYSGRYSIMTDEFYIPEKSRLQTQSSLNKQGSGDQLIGLENELAYNTISRVSTESYLDYLTLINDKNGRSYNIDNRQGLSRELARMILPLNNYTECYWKIDLHNLFRYMKLRSDRHSQKEIQLLSNIFQDVVKKICPIAYEAFEDYWLNSISVSSLDYNLLTDIIDHSNNFNTSFKNAFQFIFSSFQSENELRQHYKFSKREYNEFKNQWKLL